MKLCPLKHLTIRRFLTEGGREFHIHDPKNARPVRKKGLCGDIVEWKIWVK